VYGNINGNYSVGDGFRYRGRGYNGITFKNSYQKYGTMIGVDLVSTPDRLNEPEIAAAALAAYFKDGFRLGVYVLKTKYKIDDLQSITDLTTACKVAHQCNSGWYTNLDSPTFTSINQQQLRSVEALYQMI
jgi:hypothetical protein